MGGPIQHLQHPLSASWKQKGIEKKIDIQGCLTTLVVKSALFATIPLVIRQISFVAKVIKFNEKSVFLSCAVFFVTSFYLLALAKKIQKCGEMILEEKKPIESSPKPKVKREFQKKEFDTTGWPLIVKAAYEGQLDDLKRCLEAEGSVDQMVKEGNWLGFTSLHVASSSGNKPIVAFLLERGAKMNQPDKDGRTPLMLASENDQTEILSLLIQSGAKVDQTTTHGYTALMIASAKGHEETIELLIQAKANVDRVNSSGANALMKASTNGHKGAVDLLIKAGAKVDQLDDYDWTAFMHAAENGHKEILHLLIQAKAKVDQKDKDGRTALMIASEKGHKEVVEFLIEIGGKVDQSDAFGWTALKLAAETGHRDIVDILSK